jgi:hypothetical protein
MVTSIAVAGRLQERHHEFPKKFSEPFPACADSLIHILKKSGQNKIG